MTDAGDIAGSAVRVAFGKRLRALREARGLSQEELGHRADLHRTYVSSVERGQRNVGIENVHALARALGVSAADLFVESDA